MYYSFWKDQGFSWWASSILTLFMITFTPFYWIMYTIENYIDDIGKHKE